MQHVVGSQALAPWGDAAPVAALGNRWRPAPMKLAGFQPPKTLSKPGRRSDLGQSKVGIAAIGALPLLLGGALGAATAWVGFSTGSREKGLLSVSGYVIGALGALGALSGLVGALLWVAGVSILPDADNTYAGPAA